MVAKTAKEKNGLAKQNRGTLSKQRSVITVGALEVALLKKYPAGDAEDWDHTGILVGDPAALVTGVAVALDPTVEAIHEAKELGANVLITHHPAYIANPDSFRPATSVMVDSGAGVYAAIESGVALMCFHTALDVSQEASAVLPKMLNLQFRGILDPREDNKRKGYGQIGAVKPSEAPLTLGQLAARCTSVFGCQPRVWGSFDQPLTQIVTCTGSSGDLAKLCLASSVDCLVCGEIRYHDALAASQAGLAIIDLGHDVSELPLVTVLAASLETVGLDKDRITVIDQKFNWMYPETVRM